MGNETTPSRPVATVVRPGSFEPELHFYPRTLNAQIHPTLNFFMQMGRARIASRYAHLHPQVDPEALSEVLSTSTKLFAWAGCDLLHVTDHDGHRHMVVVETNSCPSGQKSMPLLEAHREQGGYRLMVEEAFLERMPARLPRPGGLAVVYDKNQMEASGYAATLADAAGEDVFLTPFHDGVEEPCARFEDGVLHVRTDDGEWHPIRAAIRYVTQRPWNRIPVHTRTWIFNPIVACLAGGRNKLVAAKAYSLFDSELRGSGLALMTPETIWDATLESIPMWVRSLGGHAVVKVPYSNAGQGVYTITSEEELDAFLSIDHPYNRFIVQSLIGHAAWSSRTAHGRLFHVGTVPNKRGEIHVADLRMMVISGPGGFRPVAVYARRALSPLTPVLSDTESSWDVLGTNLSIKTEDGWTSDTNRLLLMDVRDFNKVGIGIDGLIDAFVQTVLAVIAIDRMAVQLRNAKGGLRRRLFASLNTDAALLEEISHSRASGAR